MWSFYSPKDNLILLLTEKSFSVSHKNVISKCIVIVLLKIEFHFLSHVSHAVIDVELSNQ